MLRQLVVNVIEARDLLAEDINGFSDPFIAVEVLDARGEVIIPAGICKTKIAKKTLAPTWNEKFTIGSQAFDLRLGTTLRFMVYDFDGLKRDDVLGVVDIPLDLIASEPLPLDTWYKVMKVPSLMTKDARGELHLAFSAPTTSLTGANALSAKAKAKRAAAALAPGQPNLLYVTIESGKDLLAMDRNASSDPFVKLSVVGQRHQTATVEKTLKPHWDEKFAFLLPDAHTTLELLVEDEDHTINDFLGRAQVVLADVLPVNGGETRVDVPLLNKRLRADKDRGTLHLRLQWVHDPNAASVTSSSLKKKKARSLLQQLKQSIRVTPGDAAGGTNGDNDNDDDDDLIDDDELIDDESDDDGDGVGDGSGVALDVAARPPLAPGATWLEFLVATIHRAEELPPLDALLFDKGESRKHSHGGIDAYVGGAIIGSDDTDAVQTRVHTKQGRRDQLRPVFHESLMLLLSSSSESDDNGAVNDKVSATTAVLSVKDWDPIGGDEVVSTVTLADVRALAAARSGKPFWLNLYGAPLRGCSNTSTAASHMNSNAQDASTYRGRVLVTLKIRAKASDAYDAKSQKRMARKLPRELFPPTLVYRLRAHFVSAVGLAQPSRTYSLVLSCGLHEIRTSNKPATNGAVEWNETEESDKLLFPADASQVPDVFLYLCVGDGDSRRAICYQRFRAASLLEQTFDAPVAWTALAADAAMAQVNDAETFAGQVLVRLGFGTVETSNAHVWDQQAMIDSVNRRMPYQVRVRLFEAKDLVVSEQKDFVARVAVQCGEATTTLAAPTNASTSPTNPQWRETVCFDVHLPHLSVAPPVLLHVTRQANARDYVGTATLPLSPAADGSIQVAVNTAKQLKQNARKHLPVAHWVPVVFHSTSMGDANADGVRDGAADADANTVAIEVVRGHVLASVELIHKMFPDESLPPPEPITENDASAAVGVTDVQVDVAGKETEI